MSTGAKNAPKPAPTATTTPDDEISFSDLVPSRQPRSLYPHLKALDGKRVKIVDLGHDGKDDKTGYYCVLDDGSKYAIPQTIAKKIQIGLNNAKARGLKLANGA